MKGRPNWTELGPNEERPKGSVEIIEKDLPRTRGTKKRLDTEQQSTQSGSQTMPPPPVQPSRKRPMQTNVSSGSAATINAPDSNAPVATPYPPSQRDSVAREILGSSKYDTAVKVLGGLINAPVILRALGTSAFWTASQLKAMKEILTDDMALRNDYQTFLAMYNSGMPEEYHIDVDVEVERPTKKRKRNGLKFSGPLDPSRDPSSIRNSTPPPLPDNFQALLATGRAKIPSTSLSKGATFPKLDLRLAQQVLGDLLDVPVIQEAIYADHNLLSSRQKLDVMADILIGDLALDFVAFKARVEQQFKQHGIDTSNSFVTPRDRQADQNAASNAGLQQLQTQEDRLQQQVAAHNSEIQQRQAQLTKLSQQLSAYHKEIFLAQNRQRDYENALASAKTDINSDIVRSRNLKEEIEILEARAALLRTPAMMEHLRQYPAAQLPSQTIAPHMAMSQAFAQTRQAQPQPNSSEGVYRDWPGNYFAGSGHP